MKARSGTPATGSRKRSTRPGKGRSKARSASPASSRPARQIPEARFLFFGGKGGVGKTTAAVATALLLLDTAPPGKSILLISTDPAHSLSDSLSTPLGDRPTEVARRGGAILEAREMDAAAALDRFKAKYRRVLAEIADRGTLLDEGDVNQLLDLSLPGMDEVMALVELGELERSDYWRVIVNTAPSGHTTRLLGLPQIFASWITALDRLADKHRYMVAQLLGRARRDDEVEIFLRDMNDAISRVRRLLYTPGETAFVLVAIPEAMAVEETARYFDTLKREGVPVTDLIINRVERGADDCPYCLSRARSQRPWVRRLERDFKGLGIRRVPLMSVSLSGKRALGRFAKEVWDQAGPQKVGDTKSAGLRAASTNARGRSTALHRVGHRSPRPLDQTSKAFDIRGQRRRRKDDRRGRDRARTCQRRPRSTSDALFDRPGAFALRQLWRADRRYEKRRGRPAKSRRGGG